MKMKIWLFVMILCSLNLLESRHYGAKHENQFIDLINNHQFAIVCFLGQMPENIEKDAQKKLKKDMHNLQETIKATADTEPYKKQLKQDVAFIIVENGKDAMAAVLSKYDIPSASTPHILLFKDGKAITDVSGKFAQLSGFVCKADLLDFMNDYLGKEFDDILEQKAEEQAKEREMELARYQAFAASRYPYGGYAPYNVWGSPSSSIYTGYAAFYPYGYGYNGYAYLIP